MAATPPGRTDHRRASRRRRVSPWPAGELGQMAPDATRLECRFVRARCHLARRQAFTSNLARIRQSGTTCRCPRGSLVSAPRSRQGGPRRRHRRPPPPCSSNRPRAALQSGPCPAGRRSRLRSASGCAAGTTIRTCLWSRPGWGFSDRSRSAGISPGKAGQAPAPGTPDPTHREPPATLISGWNAAGPPGCKRWRAESGTATFRPVGGNVARIAPRFPVARRLCGLDHRCLHVEVRYQPE
jgi:hypothetical protein